MQNKMGTDKTGLVVQTRVKAGALCDQKSIDGCVNGARQRIKDGMDDRENSKKYLDCIYSC
jgi:hypothetical protein